MASKESGMTLLEETFPDWKKQQLVIENGIIWDWRSDLMWSVSGLSLIQ
jgi:hypothetical protein